MCYFIKLNCAKNLKKIYGMLKSAKNSPFKPFYLSSSYSLLPISAFAVYKHEKVKEYSFLKGKKLNDLSYFEYKKLTLKNALCSGFNFIFIEEPFSFLNKNEKNELLGILDKTNIFCFYTESSSYINPRTLN